MDLQLRDKTCLVTGASRGIGRGIAKVLAAEGSRVAIVARRANLLDELAAEIVAAGGTRPLIVAEDLAAEGVMERIRDRVLEEFGGGSTCSSTTPAARGPCRGTPPRSSGTRACGSISSSCAG